jgi:single-strand DNA-binding protein
MNQIYIEGRLRTRSWDDKEKVKRYSTEIIADVLQLLGKKADDQGSPSQQIPHTEQASNEKSPADEPDINNDLPF